MAAGRTAHDVGVLVDDSGRRRRWVRRAASAITIGCALFMLATVASVFAPDGFVGIRLPVIAPAGTTPSLPQAVQASLPAEVLTPVTKPASPSTAAPSVTTAAPTTTVHPTTTSNKPGNGPPTTAPSTGTTTVTTTTIATTTTRPGNGPPTSKPGNGKPTTTAAP